MKRGVATFTLDYGSCPRWLFERMVKLGREMSRVLIEEYGPDEFIKRLADPVWFQSLGTVLAFDWNASGLTTILTASLKESLRGMEKEYGVFICGGKGATSRKTPAQIQVWGQNIQLSEDSIDRLVYNSKMSAKVDSALIQDGYQLYHHTFFFSRNGNWTVVQQGMNQTSKTARRYHWHSDNIKDMVVEPHSGIASQTKHEKILNMADRKSVDTQKLSVDFVSDGTTQLKKDVEILRKHSSELSRMVSVKNGSDTLTLARLSDQDFFHHPVVEENFFESKYLQKIFNYLGEQKPKNYESLLSEKGVGLKTIRALALVSEVLYGAAPSYEDPARYSFAHGGKDAIPYPVDTKTYDSTIECMKNVVSKSHLSYTEKVQIQKKLDTKKIMSNNG